MLKATLLVTYFVLGAGSNYTVEMPSMEECLDARVKIAEQNPAVKTLCIPTADASANMNIIDRIKEKESNPNKKDGPWIAYHDNGQLWAEGTYKDGELDGPYVSYYENGQLEKQGTFKDGKMDGPWVYYYENGQLRSEGTYNPKMTPSEALRAP